ncbi:hypothetical protein R0K19_23325, partial [Bacillus sp. SIMBA_161]
PLDNVRAFFAFQVRSQITNHRLYSAAREECHLQAFYLRVSHQLAERTLPRATYSICVQAYGPKPTLRVVIGCSAGPALLLERHFIQHLARM